jgi:hypothetical protein
VAGRSCSTGNSLAAVTPSWLRLRSEGTGSRPAASARVWAGVLCLAGEETGSNPCGKIRRTGAPSRSRGDSTARARRDDPVPLARGCPSSAQPVAAPTGHRRYVAARYSATMGEGQQHEATGAGTPFRVLDPANIEQCAERVRGAVPSGEIDALARSCLAGLVFGARRATESMASVSSLLSSAQHAFHPRTLCASFRRKDARTSRRSVFIGLASCDRLVAAVMVNMALPPRRGAGRTVLLGT